MQNKIYFVCPFWGQSHLSAPDFLDRVINEGYNGIEIDIPDSKQFKSDLVSGIRKIRNTQPDFIFIAQQVLPPARESVVQYIARMQNKLRELMELQPDFVNAHTGKDHFSFEDNCMIIDATHEVSQSYGVRILHETHRGRFSFHSRGLISYLDQYPEMELVADFSHFCTVSESLLEDQLSIIEKIIPHVSHIHARIGHEQGPQVNDPFAPEWKHHMDIFIDWWKQIIKQQIMTGKKVTITPEFGPAPYMPAMPYSKQPTADQWKVNAGIKDQLLKELAHFNID